MLPGINFPLYATLVIGLTLFFVLRRVRTIREQRTLRGDGDRGQQPHDP